MHCMLFQKPRHKHTQTHTRECMHAHTHTQTHIQRTYIRDKRTNKQTLNITHYKRENEFNVTKKCISRAFFQQESYTQARACVHKSNSETQTHTDTDKHTYTYTQQHTTHTITKHSSMRAIEFFDRTTCQVIVMLIPQLYIMAF